MADVSPLPVSPFPAAPTAEDAYAQSAEVYKAARGGAVEGIAALEAATAPPPPVPVAPTEADLYAPYREQPKATYDVYAPGSDKDFFRVPIDHLLSVRGQKDESGNEIGDYRVVVRDPTGERRGVAVRDLDQALAEGFSLENTQQRVIHENEGLKGDAKAALMSYSNQLFFGVPDAVARHTMDPDEYASLETIKAEHELASTLGGITGFGGSLLVGGPLFKGAAALGGVAERVVGRALAARAAAAGVGAGAAKTLAAKILEGAAKVGVESAVIAAPEALTEAALGDPAEAAETLVINAGAGAALGAISPIGKDLFGRAAKSVFGTPASVMGKLDAYANEQAIKSHNPFKRISDRLAEIPGGEQEAGRIIREKDLVRKAGESFEDLTTRIGAEKERAGEAIGNIYRRLDEKGTTIGPNVVADDLRREILDPLEKQIGFGSRAKKVASYIDDFEAKTAGKPMAATDLLSIRRDLDTLIYGEKLPSPDQVDQYLKGIRSVFKRTLDEKVDSELGAEVKASLDKLNTQFRVLSILEKGSQQNVGRDITNRTNSLTDYISGGATSATGAIAGSLVGGPMGALVGGGASKLVGMFGNKYLRENYNAMAVRGVDKLGLLFAEQSMRHSAQELDGISQTLRALGEGRTPATTAARGIVELTGIDGTRAERYRALTKQLAEAQANVDATTGKIADVAGGLSEGGAPSIAREYTMKKQQVLSYLARELPRGPAPVPFGPKREYVPSERELAAYERKVEAAYDPVGTVTRHLASGTLTREHVQTIKELYPGQYRKIVDRIQRAAADPNAPALPRPVRARIQLLLGAGTAKPEDAARYQAPYQAGPPQGRPSGGGVANIPSPQTDVQRVSAGQ